MLDRRLLLALVLLAAGAPQVLAGSAPATESGDLGGDGWVALSLEGTGGSGQIAIDLVGSMPVSVGWLLLSNHQHPWGPSVAVVDDRDGERMRVEEGPVSVDVDRRGGSGTVILHAELSWARFTDAITVVAWIGGDVSEASYTVDAGPDATVLDQTQGTETFLALDADMGTGVEWWNPPIPARATHVEATRSIDRSMVGLFDHGQGSTDVMRAQTPQGSAWCPCGFGGTSPGEYSFQATGAGLGPQASLVLSGADVRLPAPAR